MEIINNKVKDKPAKLFQDFNASVKFIPNENEQIRTKKPLQIEFPSPNHDIEDIRKVKLHSFNHSFKDSELYVQSTIPSIKLIKRKKFRKVFLIARQLLGLQNQIFHFKLMKIILRTISLTILLDLCHRQIVPTVAKTR